MEEHRIHKNSLEGLFLPHSYQQVFSTQEKHADKYTPIPDSLHFPGSSMPLVSTLQEAWAARETVQTPSVQKRSFTYQAGRAIRQRFIGFGLVGIGIMVGGILLLSFLIQVLHLNPNLAYFIQAIASIEAN